MEEKKEQTAHTHDHECCHAREHSHAHHHHDKSCACGHGHEQHHDHDHGHHHDYDGCCGHHDHNGGCSCGHDHNHEQDPAEARKELITLAAGLVLLAVGLLLRLVLPSSPLIGTAVLIAAFLVVAAEIAVEAVRGILQGDVFGLQIFSQTVQQEYQYPLWDLSDTQRANTGNGHQEVLAKNIPL